MATPKLTEYVGRRQIEYYTKLGINSLPGPLLLKYKILLTMNQLLAIKMAIGRLKWPLYGICYRNSNWTQELYIIIERSRAAEIKIHKDNQTTQNSSLIDYIQTFHIQ